MSPIVAEDTKLAAPLLSQGKDYVGWSRQLKSWLYEQNLWSYINGYQTPIPEPDFDTCSATEAKKHFEWMSNNCKAKNMISKCLNPKYRVLIQDLDTASECWKKLNNHFMKDSVILQQQLEDEFDDFKMDFNKSMEDNLMEFNNLLSRLQYINIQHSNKKRCHKLMQSLPKSYSHLKSIVKFSSSTSLKLEDLMERIEDYAREKNHWEKPIRRNEEVNYTQKQKFNNYNNNQKSNFNNNNKSKEKSNQKFSNTKFKCSYCEGNHRWNKCPYKEKLLTEGKKLREKEENKSTTTITKEANNINQSEQNYEEDNFVLNIAENKNYSDIVIDSGCTTIIIKDEQLFDTLNTIQPIQLNQFVKEKNNILCNKGGSISLSIIDQIGKIQILKFDNALYVPNSRYNLISSHLISKYHGYEIITNENYVIMKKNKTIPIIGKREGSLYKIPIQINKFIGNVLGPESMKQHDLTNMIKNWHFKLGHVSYFTLKQMAKEGIIPKLLKDTNIPKYCSVCNKGKQTKKPFPKKSFTKAKSPNERILFDLLTLNKRSYNKEKYILGAMDEYSSYDTSYPLKQKSEAIN